MELILDTKINHSHARVVLWGAPPRSCLKLNIDGAYARENGMEEWGRFSDSSGGLKGAFSRHLPAIQSEAEACRAGLLVAIHQSWRHVEVESDCAQLLAVLNLQGEDNSEENCRIAIEA